MAGHYADITVSKANGIRFIHNDTYAAHFDNTLTENEAFSGILIKEFCQRFINADQVPVQLKLSGGTSGNEVILKKVTSAGVETVITATATEEYTAFKIYEYLITIATGDYFYLVAYTDSDTWTSEWIYGEATLPGYLKLEWFNYDPLTNNESWQFDYQTAQAQANVNFLYVKSLLFEYALSGDTSVIDNQNEKIMLRRSLFRRLKLETDPVPRWMGEKLAIAMAHDVFVVNDITYTMEEEPSIDRAGKTNFINFSAVLTQKSVLGMNTHDIGFDCDTSTDSNMIVMTETAASGTKSFTVTDDYMVLTITGIRTAGSPVLTAGTTSGGSDVMAGMSLSASYLTEVAMVPIDKSSIPGGVLYVTVSGAGATATIHVLTVKNRQ
jgi:hypothetical protein